MSTIPVSELANVSPSVIAAGGAALSASGLILTSGTRAPISGTNAPTVLSFPTGAAVSAYFGAGSKEAQVASGGTGLGTGYFGGFNGATKQPAAMLVAQYNQVPVSAYLRGGNVSGLTLSQLQAISGTLTVVFDGYSRAAGSVNLSSATSFSNAASTIQTALNGAIVGAASVTGSIAAGTASWTGTIAGQVMTVTATISGTIQVGGVISGTGVTASTTILQQLTGTTGGVGTYLVSASQTVASTTISETFGTMTVTAVSSGALAVGQTITGSGVTAATVITALGSGTGGTGTYIVNLTQTASSTTLTGSGTTVAVSYDSTSGAFVVTSGISGPPSISAFATGTAAAGLMLTQATGAVLSQGANAATPATFMNALIVQNSNWVSFMTAFDPDTVFGGGNVQKQAFAAWKNAQGNRFCYVCFDTDVTATNSLPATGSLGYILQNNNDSGTCLVYEPSDLNQAPFVCGAIASIDFTAPGGRTTLAYKSQPGLVAGVSDPTSAGNLAGNPQQASSFGNGYNFYGAYGSATTNFVWFQRGTVTGPYLWLDSYVNQIVMNYSFQNALLAFLGAIKSVPYATLGYNEIEAALAPTIQQFGDATKGGFGAFGPGTLSASQIAQVNAQAGANVAPAIQAQGYYLQILPAQPSQRAQRTSPPMTFFYLDQGSVQAINLASIALQ